MARIKLTAWWLFAALASAQVITTVAGTDFVFPPEPLPAVSAPLGQLLGVAVDSRGNVYAADSTNNLIVRISADGILSRFAGNGMAGFSGDGGPAAEASISAPYSVAVDAAGNVYIADSGNNRVRKVSGGIITTIAGSGDTDFSGDGGPATDAGLVPNGLAVDAAGNLYIADTYSYRIRKVSGGIITTVAGDGTPGFSGDGGPATRAKLNYATRVAVDASGNLFISDELNLRIRKISGGTISTVAGTGGQGSSADGVPSMEAALDGPQGLAVDSAGNLYLTGVTRIRKVSNGVITTVAGTGDVGFSGDGSLATSATLAFPQDVAVDTTGNIFISDSGNQRVRRVSAATGIIRTMAGNGGFRFSGDGGPASSATLNQPAGLAVDSSNNLYIADSANLRVRELSGGTVTTVAGNGRTGLCCEAGPAATTALPNTPLGVAVDSVGTLYIAAGEVLKVSGGVTSPVSGGFAFATGVAVDSTGALYLADYGAHRVVKIAGGDTSTVAGNGARGFSGDGGPAVSASLDSPLGVAVDPAGSLYISDSGNNRIRKVSGGIITTVAGGGTQTVSDGGPATNAALNRPSGLAVDRAGNLFIADQTNRVRKVSAGIIATVAGDGTEGFSGDGGPATSAQLDLTADYPMLAGLALDSAGDLFISDAMNHRIRKVLAGGGGVPSIASIHTAGGFPDIAQNAFIEIEGNNLAPASVGAGITWDNAPEFSAGRMPTQIGGVNVTVNGKAAFVHFVSPGRIEALTPLDKATGPVQVIVTNGGIASAPYSAVLKSAAPSFLLIGATRYVVAAHLDYSLVGPSSPARPGETITLYAVGLGLPSAELINGSSTQMGALPFHPAIQIGGSQAAVTFAGVIGPGLYQINVLVPADLADGDKAIVATYAGLPFPDGVLLSVQR